MSEKTTPRTALVQHVAADGNSQQVVSFEQMERMAQSMAKSGLFGFKQPDQIFSLMLLAHAEGKHPALVARDYDFIQGRPAKKSEAMLRDFQANGGKVEWHELTDQKADATFSHPIGGTIRIDWDIPRAERAGLAGKDGGMYKKYPRAMLRSRCISEGVRATFPGATSGMHTPEEVIDITPERETVSQTVAVEQASAGAHTLTEAELDEHYKAMDAAKTADELRTAFAAAWTHAGHARDQKARETFKQVYDGRMEEMSKKEQQA